MANHSEISVDVVENSEEKTKRLVLYIRTLDFPFCILCIFNICCISNNRTLNSSYIKSTTTSILHDSDRGSGAMFACCVLLILEWL